MSAGTEEEWIYVDLGSNSSFDSVKLYWINKALSGTIQVSSDAINWTDVAQLPGSSEKTDIIALSKGTKGRYVKVSMQKPAAGGNYILSELEVMGTGGLIPVPKDPPLMKENVLHLAGGNWKIQRSSQIKADAASISNIGFESSDWVVATVPGTVLVSYLNAGAVPDPDYADNQLMISESFFNADFWYRNEFEVPVELKGGTYLP